MSPKEKAVKLVEQFEDHGWMDEKTSMWESGRKCALIAVDEILDFMITNLKWDEKTNGNIEYWQEVKTEIENL